MRRAAGGGLIDSAKQRERVAMAHRQRTMVRKPATKFPKLRKKMQQQTLRQQVPLKQAKDPKR